MADGDHTRILAGSHGRIQRRSTAHARSCRQQLTVAAAAAPLPADTCTPPCRISARSLAASIEDKVSTDLCHVFLEDEQGLTALFAGDMGGCARHFLPFAEKRTNSRLWSTSCWGQDVAEPAPPSVRSWIAPKKWVLVLHCTAAQHEPCDPLCTVFASAGIASQRRRVQSSLRAYRAFSSSFAL